MVENRTFLNPRNQARARRYSFLEKLRIARSKRTRRSCSHPSRFSETEASQVDAWFQSFLQLHRDRKPLILARPRLECIPCFDNVLQHVTINDTKNLLEVHPNFERFINRQQDRYFERVEVCLTKTSIKLQFLNALNQENDLQFFCEKTSYGCKVTRNEEEPTYFIGFYFFDVALKELKQTLEKLHTKVGMFEIKCHKSPLACPNRKRFLSGLITVLHGFKQKLHVEKLRMTVNTEKDVNTRLNELKIGTLSAIQFEILTLSWGQVYKAGNLRPHLPYLKELLVDNVRVDIKVAELVKIPTVSARITTPYNFKMLQRYIRKVLLLPNFQHHCVYARSTGVPGIKLLNKLGADNIQTITMEDGREAVVGTFPFENQDGDILELKIGYNLEFTRKLADPMQQDEGEEEDEDEEENEVEEEKVFTNIEKMTLSLNQKGLRLEIVKRLPKRKRAVLTFNKNDYEDEFSYLKKAFNAFGTHLHAEKLKKLIVKSVQNPINDVDRNQLASGLVRALNRCNGNFHIEEIDLKLQDAFEMKAILNAIPSGMLKNIVVKFFSAQDEKGKNETFGVERHLPSLDQLGVITAPIDISLEQVAHLEIAFIEISSELTPEKISSYKNKVQDYSSLQHHWIQFKYNKKRLTSAFAEALQPFTLLANNADEPVERILKGRFEMSNGGAVQFALVNWSTNAYLKLFETRFGDIV